MNKLYILIALGLSIKADVTSLVTKNLNLETGWYAGDCLNSHDFSSTYGYVDFNCGSYCTSK